MEVTENQHVTHLDTFVHENKLFIYRRFVHEFQHVEVFHDSIKNHCLSLANIFKLNLRY